MTDNPKTFLLADDDFEDHELFREIVLEISPRSTVHSVMNGEKAIAFLATCSDKELPSLILLDYNMPKGNGPEILAILNQQFRFHNIPKVVWSTSDSAHFVQESIKNGAKAFFVKPDNFSELKELIVQIMAFAG